LRDDGYHQVDSFFHLISLHDVLTIHPADNFEFCASTDLGITDDSNLVVLAAKAMAELHGRELPAIRLELEKNIPHGAGLGGGSSNAAAAMYALSHIWNLAADDPRHLHLAAQLGSDVPLFLAPTTANLMTGKGELLKESRNPIQNLPLLIAKPVGVHSPTSAVYQAFDLDPQPRHELDVWKNNLEKAALEVSPKTAELLDWLRAQDEIKLAQVAGSGCACWARIDDSIDAERQQDLVQRLEDLGYWARLAHTVDVGICESS